MEKAERRNAGLNTFGPGAQALFHGCLGLFALLCIVPFLFVIIISFTSEDSIRQIGYSFAPLGWSTQAYTRCTGRTTSIAAFSTSSASSR